MNKMRIVGRTDIALYWPKLYRGFVEAEEIQNAENMEFDRLAKIIMLILQNSKLSQCDRSTLEAYEVAFHFQELFGETYQWGYSGPDPDELGEWGEGTTQAEIDAYEAELNSFRTFVIERIKSHKKWPLFFILAYLDQNTSGYSLTIDYDGFILYYSLVDSDEHPKVAKFINRIKPMNLSAHFFDEVERHHICISTDVSGTTDSVWNYSLDGAWSFADHKPFRSIGDGPSIWTLVDELSITMEALNIAAQSIANQVEKAVANDQLESYRIGKGVEESLFTIRLSFPFSTSINRIDKITVLNDVNNELLKDALSIELTGETSFRIEVDVNECGKNIQGFLFLDGSWLLDGTKILNGNK